MLAVQQRTVLHVVKEDIHVGNMRTFYFFSVLVRYFKFLGFDVDAIMNMTDIDDKIIQKAQQLGVPFPLLSNRYVVSCRVALEKMGVYRGIGITY